jgi:hypothetical protein
MIRSVINGQSLRTVSVGPSGRYHADGMWLDGHLDAGLLQNIHNLQKKFSLHFKEVNPVAGSDVGEDLNIERNAPKLRKLTRTDAWSAPGCCLSRLVAPSTKGRICALLVSLRRLKLVEPKLVANGEVF